LVDAGHDLDAPVALVLVTPGMSEQAFIPMVEALERAGMDAWTVRILPFAPLPDDRADEWVAQQLLPWAIQDLRKRDPRATDQLALVGHGPGGTLALMTAERAKPEAVAVLGPPMGPIDTAAAAWLAELELPPHGNVDLGAPTDWNGHDLSTLLLGEPRPALEPLPVPMARAYLRWISDGPPVTPNAIECPIWIGAGAMDRLVPIESMRVPSQTLGHRHFVRFGLLRLDPEDPGSGQLLAERRYLDVMARWVEEALD